MAEIRLWKPHPCTNPPSVRAATERFRMTNDVPAMFVQEACTTCGAEDCREQAQKLYSGYRRWCEINGHKPLSSTKIASEWRRLGFGERHLHGRKYYTGVELNPDWVEYDGLWN
jgi:phage/plasmid-associated DNA primase